MDIFSHALLPYLLGRSLKLKKEELTAFVLGGIAPDSDILLVWVNYIYPNFFLLTHRGITHSLFFGFFAGIIVLKMASFENIRTKIHRFFDFAPVVSKRSIFFAYIGVLIHLFLDYITTRGIPLLYPLATQKYSAEIFFYIDIYLTILSLILIYLYIKSRQKAPQLLLIFLIVLLSLGAIRSYEKNIALDFFHVAGSRAYPTMYMTDWYVVREDNDRIEIYEYNEGTNAYKATFQKINIVQDGENPAAALITAGELPQVKMFKWRAYTVAINAKFQDGSWVLQYYDPVQRSMSRYLSRPFSRGSMNVTVSGNKAVIS